MSVKLAWREAHAYIWTEQNDEVRRSMMPMNPFLWLIHTVINIYFWIILAMVVMSWLIAFGIVNRSNPYVRQIGYALERLTDPVLKPIRRFLPDLGGIDISPIILLIGLQFIGYLADNIFFRLGWL